MENGLLKHFSLLILVVATVATGSGCSSFDRRWRDMGSTPGCPAASWPAQWEGTWTSAVTGHTGRLRCTLTHGENEKLVASFKAWYAKILTFEYTLHLTVDKLEGDAAHVHGDADLGALAGGVYHYKGHISPKQFNATYKSKDDHGTFELSPYSDPEKR